MAATAAAADAAAAPAAAPAAAAVTDRDAGAYGARGAIAPLAFSRRGQGGQRCPFPK